MHDPGTPAGCPACSTDLPSRARFCPNCGHAIQVVAGAGRWAHGESERRMVSILFADVANSTALAESMDAERWASIMNGAFERLTPAITSYDGTVARLMGDALLAFFGAPVAHEDDPVRAVRAGLDLIDAAREYAARIQREHGVVFAVRVGVSTGEAVLGEVGTEVMHEYTAMGDAPNVAARLQAAAPPMGILIAESTHRAVANLFDCVDRGPLRMKGKAEGVRAFEVRGARPSSPRFDAAPPSARSIGSPMVGRDTEAALLVACLDGVLAGHGGVVGIIGEPGLGKSRLIAEVRRQTKARPPLWLEGSALSYGRTISFWPFREMVRGLCDISHADDAATAISKLRQRIQPLFGEQIVEVLPYLATLLALDIPAELAERVKYLDGDAIRRQIFLTVKRLFEHLARERPTVMVFEDLHWLDQSSGALLDHLLPLVRDVPLVIMGLGRPDPETPAATLRTTAAHDYAECYTEVRLKPLSDTESGRLLRNLLRVDAVPPRLRDRILAKTEGNPFFLEEVVRSFLDLGAAVPEPSTGRFDATTDLASLSIPDTVQGVIMARIDRLGSDLKQVLRVASVVGRTFSYRVVAALSDANGHLERSLADLQELELIREHRQLPDLEYAFEHALVQEATYQTILMQRRRELHRQVVTCIETLFADRLEEFYGLLAHHAARAEDWDTALHYLLLAGDQAGRMAADAEALAHYQQAMEAYARAFGDKWDPIERAVLERKIGEALFRRGELQDALDYLYRALALLGWRQPTRRWAVRGAILTQVARQAAHRFLASFGSAAVRVDPSGEERATIFHLLSWIMTFVDQERCMLLYLLLLNESERSRVPIGIMSGSMALGVMCDYVPLRRLAEFYNRRAVTLAEAASQPVALGQAYLGQGIHEYAVGNWDAAIVTLGRARASYWSAGELRGWGLASIFLQGILFRRGQFEYMGAIAQDVVRVGQDGDDRQLHGWGAAFLGRALINSGSLEEGLPVLRQSLELCRSSADQVMSSAAAGLLATALLRRGAFEEACQLVDEGSAALDASGLKSAGCIHMRSAAAEVYLAMAAQASGSQRMTPLARARKAIDATMTLGKLHADAASLASCWRGTYEWLNGKPAAARQWWQKSINLAEELEATCVLARTCVEIGRYAGDADAVQRGIALYASMGADEERVLLLGPAAQG